MEPPVRFSKPQPPPPNRPGRPRKSYPEKGRSGQFEEADEILKSAASHDYRALIRASSLAAGSGDLGHVLHRLSETPISLAKKLKTSMSSERQGSS